MPRALLVLLAVASVCACAHRTEPEPALAPASRAIHEPGLPARATHWIGDDRSIEVIAYERCLHAQRCGNVGVSKKFENVQTCEALLIDTGYDTLGPASCPRGVDRFELVQCLDQIRNDGCGASPAVEEHRAACRPVELCL